MGKKAKIVWTKALHKKFVEAVEKLGVDNAVPRKIVELMEVDGLTRDHVASHLQKYRLLLKSTSKKDSCNQAASKSSSMNIGATSWNNFSFMLNQGRNYLPSYNTTHANYPPILDTSSSYFSIIGASNFNVTTSSELAPSISLPYEGYSMQAMTNNLDQQRNLMNASTDLGVMHCLNSSNSRFVHNLDDFIYDYGGCSSEEQIYNNFEIGSSSGVQNSSDSSFFPNSNCFESNFSTENGFVGMNSLCGFNFNSNLENGIGEDDLILNEDDIATLLSYVDDSIGYGGTSDNIPVIHDLPDQDVNGDNFQNAAALDSYQYELTSNNEHQTSDGYLSGFDTSFNMYNISEHMEPIWSPDPFADDLNLEDLNFYSYVQD